VGNAASPTITNPPRITARFQKGRDKGREEGRRLELLKHLSLAEAKIIVHIYSVIHHKITKG